MGVLDIAEQVIAAQARRRSLPNGPPLSQENGGPTQAVGPTKYELARSYEVTPDVAQARYHLAVLLDAIHAGCRRGLAQHLERTPAEMTRALLANADGPSLEQWRARCEQAGEAVTLAGLVAAYRDHLRQLKALGGDIFPDAAALELALLYRPQAEEAR